MREPQGMPAALNIQKTRMSSNKNVKRRKHGNRGYMSFLGLPSQNRTHCGGLTNRHLFSHSSGD